MCVCVCVCVCACVRACVRACVCVQWHRSHGIDTLFFGEGVAAPCGSSVPGTAIAGKLAPQDGFYCLIDTSIPPSKLQNSSNVSHS